MDAEAEGFAQFVAARERALQRTARRDDPELYVRRVLVNTWARWTRRRWRGEQASESLPDRAAPGDVATEVAVRMAVDKALGSLTARERAVLVLRVFDDLSEAQVAQVLGCAVGTVKSTMARAVARLRDDPRLAEFLDRQAR